MIERIDPWVHGKRVLLLGFGREGQSTWQVLKQLGTCACVDIADQKPAAVDADGARWITGDHYQNCLDDYDVVFKSPGIVLERPIESYRCAILSQAELFFHLFRDQIIGITGAVACGKSTLGKAFLCEYPYEGHITVDGAELQNMEQSVRTGIIGYLGHDPELFNDSVENNVLLGDSKNSDTYLNAACMKQEVAEMTDGKNTLIGSGGAYLSGGQAKRLAFARTLCHDKPILILDDPFSALDKNTEKQAFVNLQALAKDSIVLLISHRLYLFPEMDGVIWMENGKAVTGTHEELLKTVPEYENLYTSQVHTTENGGAEHDAQKTSENGDF